jgi:hypothetical protein
MTFRVTIGCDPGQTGALAILADGVPVSFVDMPTMARKSGGEEVNGAELAATLRGLFLTHQGAHFLAIVEAVSAMPGQGGSGMFRFGEGFGKLKGVLEALGIGYRLVQPMTWKKHFGLVRKRDKTLDRNADQAAARGSERLVTHDGHTTLPGARRSTLAQEGRGQIRRTFTRALGARDGTSRIAVRGMGANSAAGRSMNSNEFWDDMRRIFERIAKSREPVKLFMSTPGGHPTLIQQPGYITVGVYTIDVTFRQLLEDMAEADRERRRKFQ